MKNTTITPIIFSDFLKHQALKKNIKTIFIVLSVISILSGCNDFGMYNRYQLVASSDGHVYRLDRKNGDISIVDQNTIRKISDSDEVNLVVGLFYKTEGGKIMKYVGNGKFEAAMTAEEYIKKKQFGPLGIR